MSAASSALETLEAVRGWSQRLALNLESGESLAAAPLIDLLEIIEAARRELPGGNLSWPTETDYAYRFGLVLVEERIRAALAVWPNEAPPGMGTRLSEDISSLLLLERDIRREL